MKEDTLSRGIGEYAQAYLEAWAAHEAFRRLGFPAGTIFVHKNPAPDHDLLVVILHGRGPEQKRFAVTAGPVPVEDDWQKEWTEFGESVRSGVFTEEELQAVWEYSWVKANSVDLLKSMLAKGFPIGLKGIN